MTSKLQNWEPLAARILSAIAEACRNVYADRLISLAVFGSVARGAWKANSDIDLLLVLSNLPAGRFNQIREFEPVESLLQERIAECRRAGWNVDVSPVFKTPAHVLHGSPLFLDMTQEALILVDCGHLVKDRLDLMRKRMEALKSKRIWYGHDSWTWILKPDFHVGEAIVL
ncbi:MAG: nucleotidyltransferase domain-containing protein [Verrucomicrobiae bacterium]